MKTEDTEYNLSMFEVCEKLSKSKRTVSRYVRKGMLHPKQVKSLQGTLEYRFSESDIESFKGRQDRQELTGQTEQERQDETPQAGQSSQSDYATEYKEDSANQRQDTPDTSDRKDKTELEVKDEFIVQKTPRIEKNKAGTGKTRQDLPDKSGQTSQDRQERQDNLMQLLQKTIETLNSQLEVKDKHIEKLTDKIGSLIERNREANILLKSFQDRLPALEAPKAKRGRKPKNGQTIIMPAEEPAEEFDEKKEDRHQVIDMESKKGEEKEIEPPEELSVQGDADTITEEEPKPKSGIRKKGFWKRLFSQKNNEEGK